MDNQLLKYSAKDYFFKASLCQLCVDTLNAEQAIQKYEEMFPQFGDARECKLLKVQKKTEYMYLVGSLLWTNYLNKEIFKFKIWITGKRNQEVLF